MLRLGQGLEQAGVDDDAHRPVERADEVLSSWEVDRGLASDRSVDLADESRRHRDPGHASQVRRRREADEVGRATASETDDGPVSPDPQRPPELFEHCDRLGGLPGRNVVRGNVTRAEGELGRDAVDPGDVRVGDDLDRPRARHELAEEVDRADADVDTRSGERDPVGIACVGVGGIFVHG